MTIQHIANKKMKKTKPIPIINITLLVGNKKVNYDKNSLSLTKVTSITLHIHKLKILYNKQSFKSKLLNIKLS